MSNLKKKLYFWYSDIFVKTIYSLNTNYFMKEKEIEYLNYLIDKSISTQNTYL